MSGVEKNVRGRPKGYRRCRVVVTSAQLRTLERAAWSVLRVVESVRGQVECEGARSRFRCSGCSFGERVRTAREALKVQQQTLAARVFITPSQLCQIERGRVSPSIDLAVNLARALGVRLGDLVEGKGRCE